MASAVWPASLPQRPLISDLAEKPPRTQIKTEMDVGPPKRRQRTTAGTRRFQVTYKMTGTQVSTFDTFFVDTLKHGVLDFTIPHPRTGNTITAHIDDQPNYDPEASDVYNVSFVLVEEPS